MNVNRQLIDIKKWRPQEELYIALSELDFSWYPGEVEKIKKLWAYGLHIAKIAEMLERDIDEVAVLIMDLARKNKIRRRKNGVLGEV
jgi:predicted regulator of amino acid metabolism with ACT domain